MKILSILNQKGGAGKTTISVNICMALHKLGYKVLLVDTDPQGSSRDWGAANAENPIPVVGLDRPTLAKDLKAVSGGFDYVVIDGVPQLQNMSLAAIKVSDLVVIPVQPSPFDIWACDDLVELIKTRQEITDGSPDAAFLVNRAIKNTKLSKEVNNALSDHGIPIFETVIHQRVVFIDSVGSGLTSVQVEPKGEAALEIQSLVDEILLKLTDSEEVLKNGTNS